MGLRSWLYLVGTLVVCAALTHNCAPKPQNRPPAEAIVDARKIETYYAKAYAKSLDDPSVSLEHTLFDGRRVDVLTEDWAIEVEWCRANKTAEAVEQASYYAVATGRKAKIVLLVGKDSKEKEKAAYRGFINAARTSLVPIVVEVFEVFEGPSDQE